MTIGPIDAEFADASDLALLSDKSNVRLCVNCRYCKPVEQKGYHPLFGRYLQREIACTRFLNQVTGDPQLISCVSARSSEAFCGMRAKHFEEPAGVDVMKMLAKQKEKA